MTIPEIMTEIKERYTEDILLALTEKDRSEKGYVCPVCGSGKGKHGTGLTAGTQNPNYYRCWRCDFSGDVFDIIKVVCNCQDAVSQIRKAEELLHRQFLDNKNEWNNTDKRQYSRERQGKNMVQTADNTDKKPVQTTDKTTTKTLEIQNYIKECEKALSASPEGQEYLKKRGISLETANKNHIGYSEFYKDGMGTPAIIIPTGKGSYTARSIATNEGGRKIRKKNDGNKQGIFNVAALHEPAVAIFIVEGEFDAMSIMEAGYPAIATGGGTSENEIVAAIRDSVCRPEVFVIIPDNDRLEDGTPDETKGKGYEKGQRLKAEFDEAGLKSLLVDTRPWGSVIKDCNDYLIADKLMFKTYLQGIVEPYRQKLMRDMGRMADYVQDFVNQLSGKSAPVPTGYPEVDLLLDGGLHPGLVVVGAISSLGKTTFMLNVADNLAGAGHDVIFVSLEMSRFELMAKSISRITFLDCKNYHRPMSVAKSNLGISDFDRYARYSKEELQVIEKSIKAYTEGPAKNLCVVEGVGNIGVAAIREIVRKYIAANNRRPILIIDYIQILAPFDPRATDKQNMDRNIVELKRISRDFNIPVVGISSFNRESYVSPVNMAAFKESGGVEYSSDILIGLQYFGMDHREGDTEKKRTERVRQIFNEAAAQARIGGKNDIEIKILKNRSGAKGSTVLSYYPMFNAYVSEPR